MDKSCVEFKYLKNVFTAKEFKHEGHHKSNISPEQVSHNFLRSFAKLVASLNVSISINSPIVSRKSCVSFSYLWSEEN